ncbi:MAG: hypothetical protein MJZ63_07350, partial [Muribaculaceae bacterium]|nr:hypothetical protein [Muribaculaceae bacterium]
QDPQLRRLLLYPAELPNQILLAHRRKNDILQADGRIRYFCECKGNNFFIPNQNFSPFQGFFVWKKCITGSYASV